MGDGTPVTTTDVYTTPPSPNGLARTYTYSAVNCYNVNITCANNISAVYFYNQWCAQDRITGLTVTPPGAIKLEAFTVNFLITAGTLAKFVVTLNGVDLTQASYSEVTKKGLTVQQTGMLVGVYPLKVYAYNLVSNETYEANFTVDNPIKGIVCTQDKEVINQHESINFFVTMDGGSSVEVLWTWGGDAQTETYTVGQGVDWIKGTNDQNKAHVFSVPGYYSTVINIKNNFNDSNCVLYHTVYNKVENISLTTNSPTPLVMKKAEVLIGLEAAPGSYLPTNATAVCTYGNGQSGSFDFNPTVKHMQLYTSQGNFPVSCNISNARSYLIVTTTVQIVMPVQDFYVKTMCSSATPFAHAKRGDPFEFCLGMYTGNGVTFYIDWGDGSPTYSAARVGKTYLHQFR